MLRVLDLFSGIGGFSLGLERTGGFRTVAFCEIEPFPRKVLAKHWPNVPIFEDVRKLHAEDLPEPVDVICGGYPCQPFSLAGKRKGTEDDRHLWPEIARLLRELDAIGRKPAWCLFENVAGHVNMGLDQVLSDLEGQGYTAWPLIIPACGVDAPHRRDRVWIVAHAENIGRVQSTNVQEPKNGTTAFRPSNSVPAGRITTDQRAKGRCDKFFIPDTGRQLPQIGAEGERDGRRGDAKQHGCTSSDTNRNACDSRRTEPTGQQWSARITDGGDDVADSKGITIGAGFRKDEQRSERGGRSCDSGCQRQQYWPTEPEVGRVAHGIPSRVDRLIALGNAVVPRVI